MGGATAACIAGGLSNRNPKLALIGLILGGICGRYGASTLRKIEKTAAARPSTAAPATDKAPPVSTPGSDRNPSGP